MRHETTTGDESKKLQNLTQTEKKLTILSAVLNETNRNRSDGTC